jgi:hypothetical protein
MFPLLRRCGSLVFETDRAAIPPLIYRELGEMDYRITGTPVIEWGTA